MTHNIAEQLLIKVKTYSQQMFENAAGSHDWDHTCRVINLCRRIGKKEGADINTLLMGAYLHDIGRCYQDASKGKICHAEKGAQMANDFLSDIPVSEKQKNNIIHCVISHRFRGKHIPKTKEAQVLFDADKIDSIGALGIARAYLFAGEIGARLHSPEITAASCQSYSKDDTGYREYKVKLSKIKDRIITKTGKKIAIKRHDFMEKFFKQFISEYEGKK